MAIGLLTIALLAACQTPQAEKGTPAEGIEGAGTPGEVTGTVEVTRTGAWVDTVVVLEEPNADAAVSRLEAGDLDVYAFAISTASTYKKIKESEALHYKTSYGSYNEITFNPSACADETQLNPFAVPRIREAMNYLVDREYIIQEFMGGLGTPRWVPINTASADRGRLAAEIRQIEAKYAHNPEKAQEIVSEEMEKLGATFEGGKWMFSGKPVTLIGLIRTEDERTQIGDYFAGLLQDLGFEVTRSYKTGTEAAPIWQQADPKECQFNFYTGGWVSTAVNRDASSNFNFFYTPKGLPRPLWQAYTPVQAFEDLAQRLNDNDYRTLEERKELFASALPLAMEDSVRIWLLDRSSVAPLRKEVDLAADLSGSIYGSSLWPYTLRRLGQVGGSIRWASAQILTEPWNPVAGTNWVYDTALIRATADSAAIVDPNTGLAWPQRIASLDVQVEERLQVGKTNDWVNLEFVPEIVVPTDAWVDWDAEKQVFITAGEFFTETAKAKMKTTITYPPDLFEKVKWHDGNNLTMGDMMMFLIINFDQAKEKSAIYDEAQVAAFESFMATFKGIKIVSQDPLTIEYYTDNWTLDAENAAGNFNALWPYYGYGPAPWQSIAIGVMAEADNKAAFSANKAQIKEIEQFSFIAGPTLEILKGYLDEAVAAGTVPYSPTLSAYITPEEAKARYESLQEWFRVRGHFWIGTGPFYLQRAFPVEGTVILERFRDFPDPATKWLRFSEPAIPDVAIDGESQVIAGEAATFQVLVNLGDKPYAASDIYSVSYLLFDSKGEMVDSGQATLKEEGIYEIALSQEMSQALGEGSNKLEVIVVSRLVALPSLEEFEFVTAP